MTQPRITLTQRFGPGQRAGVIIRDTKPAITQTISVDLDEARALAAALLAEVDKVEARLNSGWRP